MMTKPPPVAERPQCQTCAKPLRPYNKTRDERVYDEPGAPQLRRVRAAA